MEDRIEEFNALMETVQGEAEEIFLDTAATVHGLREGARSITTPRKDLEESPQVLRQRTSETSADDPGVDAPVRPRSS